MKTTSLSFFLALSLGTGALVSPVRATTSIPDDQCYNLAKNKDRVLENTLVPYGSGSRINPMTGQMDTYVVFFASNLGENNAVTRIRTVWGNGDADGYIGLTRYWISADGRARVNQRIYGPIWARTAYGFWWNFPFDDDPSTWVKDKEICNTL